jgi:hypothetical protein
MSEVKEMFGSPWRELQKNLASGFAAERFGRNPWICGSRGLGDPRGLGGPQVPGRVVHSWLVRARSRTVRVSRVIQ